MVGSDTIISLGEAEIAILDRLAFDGEVRGHPPEDGLDPLPSLSSHPHESVEAT